MAVQVLQTLRKSCGIGLLDEVEAYAAVHLQTLCGSHDDHQTGQEVSLAALDVEELLGTEVGTEACLSDDIVGEGHCHLRGEHTGTAVGDIGKGTAMDEGWGVFGGLHEIGIQSITQQHGDGSCHT